MPDRSTPAAGDTYAVGIARRWARIVETDVSWRFNDFTPVQPTDGVCVEYEDGTREVLHRNDVRVPWDDHVARQTARQHQREREESMSSEIAEALGCEVDGAPAPGVVTVRVPLEKLHAFVQNAARGT